jgi:CO/xanthine dehydrogenase Mo-binding subunit
MAATTGRDVAGRRGRMAAPGPVRGGDGVHRQGDIGQDNQTAFRLLVAEELAVRPDDVRVVQGDTDLCPFDIGTFGSRSMPDGGEPLRRAAAVARQVLRDLAARRWAIPAADVVADAGAVSGGPGGTRLRYGELVAGLRRLEVLSAEPPLIPPASWRTAGHSGHTPGRPRRCRASPCCTMASSSA